VQFIDSHKVGMLTTVNPAGLLVSRCMAVADRENTVDLIFHTHAESGKTEDIQNNSHVSVSFYKDSTGEWLSVSGAAELVTDRKVVEKYYSKSLKAWIGDKGDGVHDGGPQDPRIGIIRVKTSTVTYAVQTATTIVRALCSVQRLTCRASLLASQRVL
jgi:general stress protein 26